MNYIQLKIEVPTAQQDVLIALLGEEGFESFEETPSQITAYCPETAFDQGEAFAAIRQVAPAARVHMATIAHTNWNEEWERNFKPVIVKDKLLIRAPFHPQSQAFPLEIVIEPKMAFGTGHHATTSMMAAWLLDDGCRDLRVLDAGTGTGVLAILALKLGAAVAEGYDIDAIAVENAAENAAMNNQPGLVLWQGVAESIAGREPWHVILANITRNILLADLPAFSEKLAPGGRLYLAGFFDADVPALQARAAECGLEITGSRHEGEWTSLRLQQAATV